MAGWIGEPLPLGERSRLRDLYVSTAETVAELTDEEGPARPRMMRPATLDRVSSTVSAFLLREREIIGTSGEAFRRRYGRPLPETSPPAPATQELNRAVKDFLSGGYISRGMNAPPPKSTSADATTGRAAKLWVTPRVLEDPESRTRTVIVDVGQPEVIGFEPRLFIAEHPAVDWERAVEFDLVHTSIVGGIWYTVRQKQEVRTYRYLPNVLERRGAFTVVDRGTLESTRPRTVTQTRFAAWALAHGCCATYKESDTLRRVEWDVLARSWQEANQILYSYRRSSSVGWDCLNNFGTYPRGTYGANWVCHQACNAFSLWRWGIIPVRYWTNALFLDTGNMGTSPCEIGVRAVEDWLGNLGLNSNLTDSVEPCIPRWFDCPLNFAPFADGWGWQHRWAWNPDDGWRPSTMVYVEVPDNLPPGDDDPPLVEDGQ